MVMRGDDVAWEESERVERVWRHSLFEESTLRAIGHFVAKHRQGVPTELCEPKAGGFNALFRMKFMDGGSAVIRFTKPGATMFPEEKIKQEVATMRFIQDNTTIPVPFVHHWGTREESPLNIGPFIIMEYVNHAMDMIDALNTPGLTRDDRPILNPDVDKALLESLYGQMAKILLQLSKLEFPLIGALEETEEWKWDVTRRPLSLPMNELVRIGTFPQSKLPTTVFRSSSEYLESLATLHMDHLAAQRNDVVSSRADGEKKYIARHLFRKLAGEKRLLPATHDSGPFKLWCDDLRPSNMLLDRNYQIVAVIDWEFSYAAPSEFSFAPPWWLLLEQPEEWRAGLDSWTAAYNERLPVFLAAMAAEEDACMAAGRLTEDQRLSGRMGASWASGEFWTVYAARKGFAFDCVYWKELDARFFGALEGGPDDAGDAWRRRLGLLDEKTRAAMDSFVERKMAETQTRVLAWDPDEHTLEYRVDPAAEAHADAGV
ncbi:phosphotransferase family [Cordyceps militaris]|uniref:Phosphotransferase family n=1 Tax=Cordyceps militaris TaxID=73501 RepID=A0A2H4SJB6_CORMI|nr:phosphotransferase family [Cordyceps militaris]